MRFVRFFRAALVSIVLGASFGVSAQADVNKGVSIFVSVCFSEIDRLGRDDWSAARDRASDKLNSAGARLINIFNDDWTSRSEVLAGVGKVSPEMIGRNRPYLYMCVVGANGGVSRRSHKETFEGIIRQAGFERNGKAQRIFNGDVVSDGRYERGGRNYDIHILRRSRSETVMLIGLLP